MNRVGDNLIHTGSNERLVRALIDADVRFVVIGGLAVAWYCPRRQADDMDLLVEPSPENSTRIARALSPLVGGQLTNASFARPGLQVPLKEEFYAELLTPQADGLSFSDVESTSVCAKLFGMPVRLASVEALLHMKQRAVAAAEAQRVKHEADIALIKNMPSIHA